MNEALGIVTDVFGIIGFIAATIAAFQSWHTNRKLDKENERLDKKIKIILQNGGKTIELPSDIQRRDLTRAELLGRLGMIKPAKRFQLESLNTKKFFDDLDAIKKGDQEMILTISLTDSDYQQFVEE